MNMKQMKKIVIIPDQSKDYYSLYEAIIDSGFEEIQEEVEGFKNVYAKNNKYYGFIKGEYINTTVCNVELLEVDELENFEEYNLQNTKSELEKQLLNEHFTLYELNGICKEITDESVDIFDYSKSEFIEDMYGSFAYGSIKDQRGVFNVEFEIIQDNEDINDVEVKVINIAII